MAHLNDLDGRHVIGEHKDEVLEMFGDVQISISMAEAASGKKLMLKVSKILPNFYSDQDAEALKNAKLYVLVPSEQISIVWPGKDVDEIKFGRARESADKKAITSAIGIFRGLSCLYICLDPITDEEVAKLEIGSLGM